MIELIPPYVQTQLMGPQMAVDPRAMPLADFIKETMEILKSQPGVTEVVVERCKRLRFAAENGTFDATFKGLNEGCGAHCRRIIRHGWRGYHGYQCWESLAIDFMLSDSAHNGGFSWLWNRPDLSVLSVKSVVLLNDRGH